MTRQIGLSKIVDEVAREQRDRCDGLLMEDLVAYSREELSDIDARRVREVVATDPQWAQILLELKEPQRLEKSDLSEVEVDAAWLRFEDSVAPPARVLSPWWRKAAFHPLSALAAGVLLALGGGWLALRPFSDLAPQVHALTPEQAALGVRGAEPLITVSSQDLLVLLAAPPSLRAPPPEPARFEIRRGDAVIRRGMARRQENGDHAVSIPARALPSGRLELRIVAGEGRGSDPWATYVFLLRR